MNQPGLISLVQKLNNIFDRPQSLANPCGHCWRASQARMDANEVVIHVMQGNRVNMVFNLFAVRVCQSGEAAH